VCLSADTIHRGRGSFTARRHLLGKTLKEEREERRSASWSLNGSQLSFAVNLLNPTKCSPSRLLQSYHIISVNDPAFSPIHCPRPASTSARLKTTMAAWDGGREMRCA
jgi:hypothetical protein